MVEVDVISTVEVVEDVCTDVTDPEDIVVVTGHTVVDVCILKVCQYSCIIKGRDNDTHISVTTLAWIGTEVTWVVDAELDSLG